MFGDKKWVRIASGFSGKEGTVSVFALPEGDACQDAALVRAYGSTAEDVLSMRRRDVDVYLAGLLRRHLDPTMPANRVASGTARAALFYSAVSMRRMAEDMDALELDFAQCSSRGGMAFLSKESRELVAIKKVDIPPIAVDFYLRLSQALKRMAASAPADSVFAVLVC